MQKIRQLITVSPNGEVQTLVKGVLDLSKLGKISVRRSSDILFDETEQSYYVHFLDEDLRHMNPQARYVFFTTYDDAVKYEVMLINDWRLCAARTTKQNKCLEAEYL